MGINVRMQNAPKPDGIIAAQVNLEKDLKDCMRCRYRPDAETDRLDGDHAE